MATLLRTLIGFHWSYHLHGLFFSTIPHSVSSLKPSCFQPHGIVLHSDIITSCPEITEYFSGFFTPLCLLWYNARCISQLCWYPQLTVKCNSLSDVHCGHTHAEPLHLQSQEQRHKGGSEKIVWMADKHWIINLRLKK